MFLVYLFISISLVFFGLSVLGLFRFPDVYTKLHCSSLATTFGFLFFVLSAVMYLLFVEKTASFLIAPVILIALILLIVEPSLAHAVSRAAYKNGIKPKGAIVDRLSSKL